MSILTTLKKFFGLSSSRKHSSEDKTLSCMDCHRDFVFDAGEQRFFKSKGFTDPKRCPHCRKKVRSHLRRRGRNNRHRNYRQESSIIDGRSPYAD